MITPFKKIFSLFVSLSLLFTASKASWACSFMDGTGNSATPVTIKIADKYFQIPEKYLSSHIAVPAERETVIIHFPNRPNGVLTKKGNRAVYCDDYRTAVSANVDFCTSMSSGFEERSREAKRILPLLEEAKSFLLTEEPPSWKKDIEITNKLNLGKNPCGGEIPLSWDGYTPKESLTAEDIEFALGHQNTRIRATAESLISKTDERR